MGGNQLTLYELNSIVRDAVEALASDSLWVKAEISEVRVSRGHCYMEFVQKAPGGNGLIAKARGQVWANRWGLLRSYFEKTTGQSLAQGMQVLVCVEPTFHELYGYSLNVIDIDPTFTLGDIARRRAEIIEQLKADGVFAMNKELPLPRLLQRIAVISSASAAGYGDFANQLESNPYGLRFVTRLFPAVMQGDGVERSIIGALNDIAAEMDEWDVVVIIRGGGASSDLNGFDTLALAENVAQFPLPIITGIGHERDDTVIDMVSHTRVKTPTAAAEFLIQHQADELFAVTSAADRIAAAATLRLHNERLRHHALTGKLPALTALACAREDSRIQMLWRSLQTICSTRFLKETHRICRIEDKTAAADPEHVLRLGYSITRINGYAVTDASSVKSGDEIVTTLANGEIISVVE
jgi:exodeoxyribonuclease VII large subunit